MRSDDIKYVDSNDDLREALGRLIKAKKSDQSGVEGFFGDVTFHFKNGKIGYTTIKQVYKEGR